MQNIITTSELRKQVNEIYKEIPECKNNCQKLCLSGKCKFECCTVTGCAPIEAVLINTYIKKERLSLPLIKDKVLWGYLLPNSGNIKQVEMSDILEDKFADFRCSYLSDKGCLIYEQRPIICRLFGLVETMICPYTKNQKLLSIEESVFKYLNRLVSIIPLNADIKIIYNKSYPH